MINDNKIRAAVYGCFGRMGTVVSDLISKTEDMEVVAGFDTISANECHAYPVYNSISEYTTPTDVVINFLPPTAIEDTLALIKYSTGNQVPMVACTTALPQHVCDAITEAATKVAIFQSANLSLGLNLFTNILSRAAKMLYNVDFDIEIIERHHNKKLDAPSGTAYLLADIMNNAIGGNLNTTTDRSQLHQQRSRNEIGVHSIRGGSIVGEHSVLFAGVGETLEFTHAAQSREVFAVGALRAARFIIGKKPGLYGMQDLISSLGEL